MIFKEDYERKNERQLSHAFFFVNTMTAIVVLPTAHMVSSLKYAMQRGEQKITQKMRTLIEGEFSR